MLEDAKWHNEMIESLVLKTEKLKEGKQEMRTKLCMVLITMGEGAG
jgi:hypothetical protein